jgi:hypothetical protein
MMKLFENRKFTVVLIVSLFFLVILTVGTLVLNDEGKEAFNGGNTIVEVEDPTTDPTDTEMQPVPSDENNDEPSDETSDGETTQEEVEDVKDVETVKPTPTPSTSDGDKGKEGTGNKGGKEEAEDNSKGVVTLKPKAQLPDLDMGPQKSYSVEEALGFRVGTLTPVYHDTFRYQIREFEMARLVIDIGNTGSKTLVITDANLYFSILDTEGNQVAGSKVQGAPISIAPGEVKRVIVTAKNPDAALVHMDIDGVGYTLSTPFDRPLPHEEADIINTKPYKDGYVFYDDAGLPYTMAETAGEVIGNGDAKVMGIGVLPVDNEKIGPIDKGNGFLALVKFKIANTTNEEMTIEKILSNGAGENVFLTPKDLAILGDKALPSTIKPNTIVEGWIPFRVGDGREGYSVAIYTSHGRFVLHYINRYPIF